LAEDAGQFVGEDVLHLRDQRGELSDHLQQRRVSVAGVFRRVSGRY
jgi:hypothetical protein